jgi:hypothetical protein
MTSLRRTLRNDQQQEENSPEGSGKLFASYKVPLQMEEIEFALTGAAPLLPSLSFLWPSFTPTTTAITATMTSKIHALIAIHPFLYLLLRLISIGGS